MMAARIAGIFLLVLPTISAAAGCNTGLQIGRIERVERGAGDAEPMIKRVGAGPIRAATYTWLCQGDEFEIAGTTKVFASFGSGNEQPFDSKNLILAIDRKSAATPSDPFSIDTITMMLGRLPVTRKVIQYFPEGRDPSNPRPKLFSDTLLPAGPQTLPNGYNRVALLWRGGAGVVRIEGGGAPVERSSGRRSFLVLDLPQTADPVNVALDRDIVWKVTHAGDATNADAAERISRAIVILRDGPAEKRLYALSELASLSAQGEYVAEQFWTAACTGDLAAALRQP